MFSFFKKKHSPVLPFYIKTSSHNSNTVYPWGDETSMTVETFNPLHEPESPEPPGKVVIKIDAFDKK